MPRLKAAIKVARYCLAVSVLLGANGCDMSWWLPVAPTLTGNTISGRVFDLTKTYGYPVVVVFWSPTCSACVREIPGFIELHREFKSRGLRIVLVAMPYDIPSQVLDFTKRAGLEFDVMLDVNGRIGDVWKVTQIPASFLVDSRGRVLRRELGLPNFVLLKRMINEQFNH